MIEPRANPDDQPWECTLEEVAKELGVSVARARQIEMKALCKLRWWCERNGLRLDDLKPAKQ